MELCLDIETVAGSPDDALDWMRRCWEPSPSWKPETIGSRWQEMYQRKLERLALIDRSPIVSVAFRSDDGPPLVIHWLDFDDAALPASLWRVRDEREMLIAARGSLDADDLLLVGHNILHFDLPRLRHAYARHGLRLPVALCREQPAYDTMREYSRWTTDSRQFVCLSELLDLFRIPNHKAQVDGADVGRLYEQRDYRTLLAYAALDVVAEYELFRAMVGLRGA